MREIAAGCFVLVVLVIGAACSSSSSSIGNTCTTNSDCTTGQNPICLTDGVNVCSSLCNTHFDCGCPSNTTNSDIVAGKCPAACYTIAATDAGTLKVCVKVCTESAQCNSSALTCQPTSDGYSVCQ